MFNRRGLILLGAMIVATAGTVAQAAPIVSVGIGPARVSVGQTIDADVHVEGIADLYAFQFDLMFDPTVLDGVSVSEGVMLSSAGPTFFVPGTIDRGAGAVSLIAGSLQSAVSGANGAGVLARVRFQATGLGHSTLRLANVILIDSTLSDIEFDTRTASITVTAGPDLPEPGALLLTSLAIAAAGTRAKRARARSRAEGGPQTE